MTNDTKGKGKGKGKASVDEDDLYDEETGQRKNITLYQSKPRGGDKPILWVPIHKNALSTARQQEQMVTLEEGPYGVVYISLEDPGACRMADLDLWPENTRRCLEVYKETYSEHLNKKLKFGAMVAFHHWNYWITLYVQDPMEQNHIKDYVMGRDNNHTAEQSTDSVEAMDPESVPSVLEARRQHQMEMAQTKADKWRAFASRHRASDNFLLRVAAHKAQTASYFVLLDTAAPELEQLKQRQDVFHPHTFLSAYGYAKNACTAWKMGSIHQQCSPFEIQELERALKSIKKNQADKPNLRAVHFEQEKEL